MKKEYKLLLILFIISLVIRLAFVSPFKYWDETVYSNLGYDLSKNPFDYSFADKGWSDFVPTDWPRAGFRAPLLPYILSIFYFLNLSWLINLLMAVIGALSVVFVFLLAKTMFSDKIALYSATFLSLLPLHVYYSGHIMTDVFSTFFVILAVLFFWHGFEKGNDRYKLLFGLFLGLSILARYTTMWMGPIFFAYLVIRNKNFSFMKDRFIWLAVMLFLVTLSPWFIYGIFSYGNPLGPFIHGAKSAAYWGGAQPWYFFLEHSLELLSVLSIVFAASLIFVLYRSELRKNAPVMFLLLWFFVFFAFITLIPHKESRYLMPLTPSFAIISAMGFERIKSYKNFFLALIIIILGVSIAFQFLNWFNYTNSTTIKCFLGANSFLLELPADSVAITTEFSTVHYYTKKDAYYYPEPFSLDGFRNMSNIYKGRQLYILFSEYPLTLENPENQRIKNLLDSTFQIVYRCPEDGNSSIVYRYK